MEPVFSENNSRSLLESMVYAVPLIESIVPIIKTIIILLFALFVLHWFKTELKAFISIIVNRLKSGSAFKAGPFEMSEWKPQDAKTQRDNLAEEVAEVEEEIAQEQPEQNSEQNLTPKRNMTDVQRSLMESYSQAEYLGMRAKEVDVGVHITRQVSIKGYLNVDGLFIKDGIYHVVEVKFTTKTISRSTILRLISNFRRVQSYASDNSMVFNIVVVTADDESKEQNVNMIKEISSRIVDITILVDVYTMSELKERFLPVSL